jgi:hypothetical protein
MAGLLGSGWRVDDDVDCTTGMGLGMAGLLGSGCGVGVVDRGVGMAGLRNCELVE